MEPGSASVRDTIQLLLAPDEATFQREVGGRFPDWGLAVAFPESASIVMRSPRLVGGDARDPGQVLAHELVHVYLALELGPAEPRLPRWLHEGLASLLAGEWGLAERFDLALTLLARRPIPLERLEEGFPSGKDAAALAYLESLAAAAHLRGISGDRGLRTLLGNVRRQGDFDAALRRTYGLTYREFEERWRDSLAHAYGWATVAAGSWSIWTPAALAVLLLVFFRRARYRARLARLAREELLNPIEDVEWQAEEQAPAPSLAQRSEEEEQTRGDGRWGPPRPPRA